MVDVLGLKGRLQSFLGILHAENVKGILETVKLEEKLCDEVETVQEFTQIGDWVSACGGSEVAVTAKTRYGLVKSRECDELLHGRKFPLKLDGAFYESCVRLAILYESKAWAK